MAAREQPVRTIAAAVDAFLARGDLAASSRRSYAQTLSRLVAWGACAPATWNRHVATARSFVAFCHRRGWLVADVAVGVDRRREPADRTRAIAYAQLARLWRRSDVAVREKALWRLLYETAARASEVLSLDVGDVDLETRRAVVRSKGGDLELLHFQTGSARLLPRLIAGRRSGPVFLTDRRPAPGRAPATVDVCPVTGRARLSYRRAEEIFRTASGGWTLHQLRHSAITHLAEDNVGLALLMAKSRHTSLRSLQRYARPGADAVAALTAVHDRDRRRP